MLVRATERIKFPAGEGWVDTVLLPPRSSRRMLVIQGLSGSSRWTEGLIVVPEDKIEIDSQGAYEKYYLKPGNYSVKEGVDTKGNRIIKLHSAPEDLTPLFRLRGFNGFIAEDKKENEGIKTLIKAEGYSRTGYNGTRWSLAAVPGTAKIIITNPYSYEGYKELYYSISGEKLAEVEYYSNGKPAIKIEYKNNKIHAENYPALIEYFDDGRIKILQWYKDGRLHREDGPAVIYYYHSGKKARETWYKGGNLHREDGPAEIKYEKDGTITEEYWYIDGVPHREDGPAKIKRYANGTIETEEWKKNGLHHREDGPAIIWYYSNGQIEEEQWWVDNKRHRTDGPAVIRCNENGEIEEKEYYIDGKMLTEENFIMHTRIDDLLKKAARGKKVSL